MSCEGFSPGKTLVHLDTVRANRPTMHAHVMSQMDSRHPETDLRCVFRPEVVCRRLKVELFCVEVVIVVSGESRNSAGGGGGSILCPAVV